MKKLFCLVIILLMLPALLSAVNAEETHPDRLIDRAGMLDDASVDALTRKLDEISLRQNCDVAVFICAGSIDSSPKAFSDSLYDDNGYGIGNNRDGILLVVDTMTRDWYITTTGLGMTAINDKALSYISGTFAPYLTDGNYYQAITNYADNCDFLIAEAKEGHPYGGSRTSKSVTPLVIGFAVSLAIGTAVGFLVTGSMKRKLKSVEKGRDAVSYIKGNSFLLTGHSDVFLYRDMTAIPISSSRNSCRHSGGRSFSSGGFSGGSSHGGGGGKF